MKSRIATLLLLAALAAVLYSLGRSEDLRVQPVAAGGPLYPGLEPAAVNFVSMRFRTGHVVDIEREAGGPWRITYPPEARELAQAEFVESVIRKLSLASVIPLEAQGAQVNPADVGLAQPQFSITFGIGEHRTTLLIGDKDVFGKGLYARREGDDQIVLTTPNLRTMVEQFRAEDYVDKHLLRGLRGNLNRVRIERPEGVLLDATLTGGRWSIAEPVPSKGDDARIMSLVRSLQFSRQVLVAAVAPEDADLAQLGLPNADQVARGDWADSTLIELYAPGEPPARLFVERDWAGRSDGMYVIREDLYKLLEAERNQFNLMSNEPDFFRERRLVPPVQERAQRFALLRDGEALLDIRRDSRGGWAFAAPQRLVGLGVDSHRIEGRSSLSDFLQRVDGLEASGFCEPPLGEPEAVIEVSFDQAGVLRVERLELFDLQQDVLRARATWRPGEGLLLAPDVAALFGDFVPDSLRSLTPLNVPLERWTRLELQSVGAEVLSVSRAADGHWTGDDEWGRRYGLGHDLVSGLRGYSWSPTPAEAVYPWVARFLDGSGEVLAQVSFRRPMPDEPQEILGVSSHRALVSGLEHAELVLPDFWLQRLEALLAPPGRPAMQTVPVKSLGPPAPGG
ncbi:MAG: hypothetical protein DRQ55_07270 [Planctomycetota bacterium]|nr:MAG: hypothetical protein DRQ55_07270 [Planctomycetota bacterium]